MWNKEAKYRMNEYLINFPNIYQNILDYLSHMQIFIAKYDDSRRYRQRIEGGIANTLRKYDKSKEFLDELTRYSYRWEGEDALMLKLNFPYKIIGFENELIEI